MVDLLPQVVVCKPKIHYAALVMGEQSAAHSDREAVVMVEPDYKEFGQVRWVVPVFD